MRQDQLQKARQARWRQDGNALLTLDDAERWLAEIPLCLYLPRHQHLPVPAPSFVEAVAGRADATPAPEQIAAATQMLARLVASGAAIALNLFGSHSGMAGEQPDFLATPESLPYLYALQAERNPKRPPSTTGASRVSPLAAEAYALLEREGALTTGELRERLGREVTEAATLRALGELWHSMRVAPVPDEHGAPAHWELLGARHRRELNVGSTQSQTTALSILVSFYLQSAVAASGEQAEIFLSPLASRSRIREVIHGLSATRQLASFPLNGEAQLYVEGTLPELPEEEAVPDAIAAADLDAGLEQNEPSFSEAAAAIPAAALTARARQQRPGRERPDRDHPDRQRPDRGARIERRTPRPSFGDRARGRSNPRDRGERPAPRREGGFRSPERRSFRKPESGEAAAPPRRSFERTDRSRPDRPRPDRSSSDRPPRREGGYRSFRKSESGESSAPPRRSFERKDRSERPPRRDQPGRPRFERERPPRREFQKPFGKGRPDRVGRPDRGSESGSEQRTDRRPQSGGASRPQTRGGGRPEGRGFERPQEGYKPANRFGKPGGKFEKRRGDFENRSARPSVRSSSPGERSGGRSGQRSSGPGERSGRFEDRRGRFEDRGGSSERRGDRFNPSRGPRATGSFEGRSGRPERDARGPRDRRSGEQPGNVRGGSYRPARPFPSKDRPDRPPRGEDRGRPREDRPGQRPFSGRPPRRESQGAEQRPFRREGGRPGGDFRKPSGGKRFGAAKPGGNFKPKGKRPGGFAPPRRKPSGESGGGDEG